MDRIPESNGPLGKLGRELIRCSRCPRLVRYLSEIKTRWPEHWCRPVPGFGDPHARIVLVGLAPGRHGSNRTGRMFTGDASGQWLYRVLHETGFCSRSRSHGPGDGLALRRVYITAAVRCAPPGNKPTQRELDRCRPWLSKELSLLRKAFVFIGIGRIGHDAVLKVFAKRLSMFPFEHGRVHDLGDGRTLLDTYHCSRQNTNTGVLTWPMFMRIFKHARILLAKQSLGKA